jgi:hypothetical protein
MKRFRSLLIGLGSICVVFCAQAQGTFQNLNLEAADLSGYTPGSSGVPISAALPGWIGLYETNQTSQVWYDGISLGAAMISVIDTNAPSFGPLRGRYSAFLFGGLYGVPTLASAGISQTGFVPAGTQSLLVDAYVAGAPFVVALGGQKIDMIPLQSLPNYTSYGGDISSFAGQNVTLSFTEPPATGVQPSMFELDNIVFSASPAPEPSIFNLLTLGSLLFARRLRGRKPR